jgi:hypothetical protein
MCKNIVGKHIDYGICRTLWKSLYGIPISKHIFPAPSPYILKRWQPREGVTIEEYRTDFASSAPTVLPTNLLSNNILLEVVQYKKETDEEKRKRLRQWDMKNGKLREQKIIRIKDSSFSGAARRSNGPKITPLMQCLLKKK